MTQPFNMMPLFAVPLITWKIADTAAINAGLRRAVLAREAAGPGMTRSNADGWHSEQNLLVDDSGKPVSHPDVPQYFGELRNGYYALKSRRAH